MVAVQRREHDAVDLVRIETLRLEGDKRGRPAIDEQLAFRCFEKEAGVEPAAGAEGITRSDDRQAHGQADAVYTENSLNSYSISLSPNRHSNSLRPMRRIRLAPIERKRASEWLPICSAVGACRHRRVLAAAIRPALRLAPRHRYQRSRTGNRVGDDHRVEGRAQRRRLFKSAMSPHF